MIGVYKITNKINNKAYIGASNNIDRRWTEHKRGTSKNNLLYFAFKKYGQENFNFEVLEECSLEILYQREIYWINHYRTFGRGYNLNAGGVGGGAPGEVNGRSILTEEDVIFIRKAYLNNESKIEVFKKYFLDKISFSGFCSIWQGYNWKHIMPEIYTEENKQKHIHRSLKRKVNVGENNSQSKLNEEQVLVIIGILINTKTLQKDIAKKYDVSLNTINLINRCKTWTHLHNFHSNIRIEGSK